MNKSKALISIVRAIKKPAHMVEDREYKDAIWLDRHPFSLEKPDFPSFHFAGFSSDSIYPLLYHLLTGHVTLPISTLIFWLCQQKDDPRHHQIFAEAGGHFERFLCSGMTDFSGAGSAAYLEMKNVFEFLAEVYGIQVEYKVLEPGRDDQAWAMINQAGREQMAGVEQE